MDNGSQYYSVDHRCSSSGNSWRTKSTTENHSNGEKANHYNEHKIPLNEDNLERQKRQSINNTQNFTLGKTWHGALLRKQGWELYLNWRTSINRSKRTNTHLVHMHMEIILTWNHSKKCLCSSKNSSYRRYMPDLYGPVTLRQEVTNSIEWRSRAMKTNSQQRQWMPSGEEGTGTDLGGDFAGKAVPCSVVSAAWRQHMVIVIVDVVWTWCQSWDNGAQLQ